MSFFFSFFHLEVGTIFIEDLEVCVVIGLNPFK